MKKMYNLKQLLLFAVIALGFMACSKKDDPGQKPVEVVSLSIEDLKKLSTGASVGMPEGRKIKGIVISDAAAKNIDAKTAVLQEATGKPGIVVNFDAAHSLVAGDEVEIDISGKTLAQVNGEIVLQNIPVANAKKTAGGSIAPRETTIADIIAGKAGWNGTLVRIAATELTSVDGKYNGRLTVKDASGSLVSLVAPGAAFENTELPGSVSELTGIVRINGNDTRIDLRTAADVKVGAIKRIVTIDFSTITAGNGSAIDFSNQASIYAAHIASGSGFRTVPDVGVWGRHVTINGLSAANNVFPVQNLPGDEAVTNGKPYFYIPIPVATGVLALRPDAPSQLKGLKTVTITFAYSLAGMVHLQNTLQTGAAPAFESLVFDPAADKIRIGVSTFFVNRNQNNRLEFLRRQSGSPTIDHLLVYSPEYNEPGKDYTFTYTMPTAEEAKAKGALDGDIEKYLEDPAFVIFNSCISANSGAMPVIIKKIVLGFTE